MHLNSNASISSHYQISDHQRTIVYPHQHSSHKRLHSSSVGSNSSVGGNGMLLSQSVNVQTSAASSPTQSSASNNSSSGPSSSNASSADSSLVDDQDIKSNVKLRFLCPDDVPELKILCSEWFPVE